MADPAVTLEQVKPQLKLEADEHEQDGHVQRLIDAAVATVEGYLSRDIVLAWPDPDSRQRRIAAQAIALLVEEWFVTGAAGTLPDGVVRLLRLIRIPRI